MPSNNEFEFRIMISGQPVPEYEKNGDCFVECKLDTPYSYKENVVEDVKGENETQEYPVTPYQIKITTHQDRQYYYRVCVDGVKVKGLVLKNKEFAVIKGFRDRHYVREFLFSLPRFARDENDRVNTQRAANIGMVKIQVWHASLRISTRRLRDRGLDYQQANKKDSATVTKGAYIMATSRVGKVVCGRSKMRNVDSWKLTSLISTLSVRYHMAHSLRDMGFTLRPMTFPPTLSSQPSRHATRRSAFRETIKEEERGFLGSPEKRQKRMKAVKFSEKKRSQVMKEAEDSLLALQDTNRKGQVAVPPASEGQEEIAQIGQELPTPPRKSPIVIDLTEDDEAGDSGIEVVSGDFGVKVEVKDEPETVSTLSANLCACETIGQPSNKKVANPEKDGDMDSLPTDSGFQSRDPASEAERDISLGLSVSGNISDGNENDTNTLPDNMPALT